MSHSATTRFWHDTRRVKQDETYPVKLVVTYRRKRHYYSTDVALTKEDFAKVMRKSPKGGYKEIRDDLKEIEHDAINIIKDMKKFSRSAFAEAYHNPQDPNESLFTLYKAKIAELRSNDQISTANLYHYSMESLKTFTGHDKLDFDSVDVKFLSKYESHMLSEGASITTVGIYLRHFKAILNIAKHKGYMDNLPFGSGKDEYQIKSASSRNIAISEVELKAIFVYKAKEGSVEQMYVDMWKFSYLCGGMNVKDLCLLRWKNVLKDRIMFIREKTKRTNFNGVEVVIIRDKYINEILKRWGQDKKSPNVFVFPFINGKMNAERVEAKKSQVTDRINHYINKVAERIGIDDRITTYTARHTYANHLMNNGITDTLIGKKLAHTQPKTTQGYLGTLGDRQEIKLQSIVTNFMDTDQ